MVILNQHFYENKLTFILNISYYILKVEIKEKIYSFENSDVDVVITELGGAIVIGLATVALFFAIRNKRLSFAILGNILGVLIVNQVFKFLIQRPRPDVAHRLIEQSGYSFPSGHSMCSMAFYGFLIYLAFRYVKNVKVRVATTVGLGVLVFLIGFSRVYLGVHYASDVIAGFLLAVAYLIFYISLINFINFKTRQASSRKSKHKA